MSAASCRPSRVRNFDARLFKDWSPQGDCAETCVSGRPAMIEIAPATGLPAPRRGAHDLARTGPSREEGMPKAANGKVSIEYESFGEPTGEAVLLINGLGSQMTRWPEAFCALLVGKGLYVIRFDNRDVGLSTWLAGGEAYAVADMV